MTGIRTPTTATLREMLAEPQLLILPGVFDALSASLAEQSGFRALYISGAAVSMAMIGYPDLGFVTLTEMAGQAARISGVTTVPIVADADTGFGNALSVQRTVREYERAGISGIQLEDQAFPKRCGHLSGKTVTPAKEFVEKIHAAREARRDPSTVLIARTDARGPLGYDEAIARANAYVDAGADLIFVEAPESEEEIARIPRDVSGPTMFNVVRGGYSPTVTPEQLAEWGYAMAILPGALITPVVKAIVRALAKNGAPRPLDDQLSGPAGLFGVVGLADWLAASERYAAD